MKAFQSRPSPVFKPHRSREAAAARFPAEARLAGLQAALNAAAPAQRLRAAQGKANGRDAPAQRMDDEDKALQEKALQRVDDEDTALQETPIQHRAAPYARPVRVPLQRKGGGGLPDDLRSGIESLSGLSMDGVRVHRNSAAPARVGAHAYAQGTDIHLAPGQDRHLPHEAWHVVQQAQGRVRPTMDVAGTPVNDDAGLEAEADRMGAQALQRAAALDWQPLAMLQRNADGEEMADVTGPDGLEVAFLPADRLPALRRRRSSGPLHTGCARSATSQPLPGFPSRRWHSWKAGAITCAASR